MKKVSDSLMNYFVNEKSFLCCDLYQLALEKGKKYFLPPMMLMLFLMVLPTTIKHSNSNETRFS